MQPGGEGAGGGKQHEIYKTYFNRNMASLPPLSDSLLHLVPELHLAVDENHGKVSSP